MGMRLGPLGRAGKGTWVGEREGVDGGRGCAGAGSESANSPQAWRQLPGLRLGSGQRFGGVGCNRAAAERTAIQPEDCNPAHACVMLRDREA